MTDSRIGHGCTTSPAVLPHSGQQGCGAGGVTHRSLTGGPARGCTFLQPIHRRNNRVGPVGSTASGCSIVTGSARRSGCSTGQGGTGVGVVIGRRCPPCACRPQPVSSTGRTSTPALPRGRRGSTNRHCLRHERGVCVLAARRRRPVARPSGKVGTMVARSARRTTRDDPRA